MGDSYKVTRRIGKAHTLPTAPAYTFAGRHDTSPSDPGPGPGQYGPLWGTNTRGTGFGSSKRPDLLINNNPGSNAYGRPPLEQIRTSKPAFSFGGAGKSRPERLNGIPGPGTYDDREALKLVKPSPNAKSLSFRPEDGPNGNGVPAPNHYDPSFSPKEAHAATIKFRNTAPPTSGPTPSPQDYDTRPQRSMSAGKTFGTSRPGHHLNNGVPGPGEYGSPYEPGRATRASWSIGRSSRDNPLRSYGPGPGAYTGNDPVIPRFGGHGIRSDNRSAPAYSLYGKPAYQRPGASPGPSDYGVPAEPGRVTKPAHTMGGVRRDDTRNGIPGPGTYNPEGADGMVRASAPAVSLSFRPEDAIGGNGVPGPGMYDAKDADGKIPISLKFRNYVPPDNAGNPAPHDYADKDFRGFSNCCDNCGKKGFTMRPRYPEPRRHPGPGPDYAVGVSTLGIAAAPEVEKATASLLVVL
ncbi:hypothetical protein HYH03_001598 [Edaphochlamys debaryana]|uniref:Outer dense fiber protein 3 n=1 Tax=Edaphochlamys debaryana TaxID=47281 RepID=A0A835YDZ5_9CHLO|nr:hypothetical protein HYH03_001598 [Edaphochlamys debaryana]|eukprot:KAG2500836.1 hypothetical protein HYH03_001598 [Edaphochlamys debaryana]